MDAEWYWLIPAVVVASWIIRGLLRSQEEDTGKSRLATPRADMAEERPARPANDVDRFLEEINRLRRKSAEERGEPARQIPPRRPPARPPVREAPRPRPIVTVPEVVPVRRAPQPQPPAEVFSPLQAIPVARVAPVPTPTLSELSPPTPASPPVAAAPLSRAISPALTLLATMLSTGDSLRTAFLVREVFGAPLCKRRRT